MYPNNCFKQRNTALRPSVRPPLVPAARSLQPVAKQMRFQRFHKRNRTGSLIIECVIASVILASCSIALLKWTHAGNQLQRQANTQTAAVLVAENAADRLNQTTIENASTFANSVATELSELQSLGVAITSSEFTSEHESGPVLKGIHFTITVSQGDTPITVKHSWKLGTSDELPVGTKTPSGTNTPSTEKQEGTANE